MLRISSCTITVLPVPAPPNRPIFEPLANVQMRSTTLMPVSRISTFACCSDTGGAGRWMGQRVMPSGAGSSSMGAPITLNMRPSVSTPTGTEMGAPVATTLSPRRNPSVASMAMQRTTLSPMAPSTSSTTVRPSLIFTRRASNSSGWSPGGNSTSTTAPMTWLTLPSRVLLFVAAIDSPFLPLSGAHGLGAAHDFHQLGGDAGLADLVRVKRQRVDQVAGGVGRVLHGDHLGRVLAGLVLQHGLEDLRLHVAGKQAVQDGLGVGLVDVVGARPRLLCSARALRNLGRDERLHRRVLTHGRDPLRVAEDDRVGVALRVLLKRDRDGGQDLGHRRPVGNAAHLGDHLTAVAQEEVAALAADRDVALALRVVLVHEARRRADVVDVDGAAQALVGGDQHHHRALALTADQERV